MHNRLIALFLGASTLVAGYSLPAAALDLPFGLGASRAEPAAPVAPAEAPVRFAQAGDPLLRIGQLEEEVRRLNGRIEELSFQLLQMQEAARKQQEDNEFRFQELEGTGGRRTGVVAPPAAGSGDAEFAAVPPPAAPQAPAAPGEDQIGQILDSGLDLSGLEGGSAAAAPPPSSETVASISPEGPGEMYDLAYNYLLAGDYQLAEDAFRQYAQTYPNASDAPDAKYWLGESLFAQGLYTDAAEVFLNAQTAHPDHSKAPEMMLKLGMSLAQLDNRETACVTFAEVSRRYPQISSNVKRKLEDEQAAANCS